MNPDEVNLTLAIDTETGEVELQFTTGDKKETYVLSKEQGLLLGQSIVSVLSTRATSLN